MLELYTEEGTDTNMDAAIDQVAAVENKTSGNTTISVKLYDKDVIESGELKKLPNIAFHTANSGAMYIVAHMKDTVDTCTMAFDWGYTKCKTSKWKDSNGVTVYRIELTEKDRVKGVSFYCHIDLVLLQTRCVEKYEYKLK